MKRHLAQGETMDEAVDRVDTSGDHLTSAVDNALDDFDPRDPAMWMALADGELDQAQSRAVRQVLQKEPQTAALARAMVQAMDDLGNHVREVWRERDLAHADDIAANVMARVLAQQSKQQQPPAQSQVARAADGTPLRSPQRRVQAFDQDLCTRRACQRLAGRCPCPGRLWVSVSLQRQPGSCY